ncbi:MAG: YHS domain-containing (seleno)protein [Pseudomonadota bacterium]
MNRRTFIAAGAALLGVGVAGYAVTGYALRPQELARKEIYAVDGVALGGTDTVAYFTDGGPVAGSAEFSTEWAGATWHFASAENRDRFLANPKKYAPAYGGFCAWAVAEHGKLYSTNENNWAVVDGRLYLNYNDSVQTKWDKDRAGFIEEGDRRWPEIMEAKAAG